MTIKYQYKLKTDNKQDFRVNIMLNTEVWEKFKELAQSKNKKPSSFIREMITQELAKAK